MTSKPPFSGLLRFRGFPRHLHPGPEALFVRDSSSTDAPLPSGGVISLLSPCQSCEFVCYYHLVLDCGHIVCEDCVVCMQSAIARSTSLQQVSGGSKGGSAKIKPRTQQVVVRCGVCRNKAVAQSRVLDSTIIDAVRLFCHCGYQGTLEQLCCHRATCKIKGNSYFAGETRCRVADIVEVKGIILEELRRLEEDIMNKVEVKQIASANIVQKLETDIAQAAERFDSEIQSLRLKLQRDVSLSVDNATIDKIIIGHRSSRQLFWFNIKEHLKKHNATGEDQMSDMQSRLVGGYPLGAYIAVGRVDNCKCLGVYVCASSLGHSADWPIKRQIDIRLYDGLGYTFREYSFKTTSEEAVMCFSTPNSSDGWGKSDMCTISELSQTAFYKQQNGMVCIGIEVKPL